MNYVAFEGLSSSGSHHPAIRQRHRAGTAREVADHYERAMANAPPPQPIDYVGEALRGIVFAAGYMFVAEREATLVGDRGNATNADAAGERVGLFTVASPWPILIAFGVFGMLVGLALYPPLAVAGAALLVFGLLRLGRESR